MFDPENVIFCSIRSRILCNNKALLGRQPKPFQQVPGAERYFARHGDLLAKSKAQSLQDTRSDALSYVKAPDCSRHAYRPEACPDRRAWHAVLFRIVRAVVLDDVFEACLI